ncbi:MAG: hypothetical protein LBT64_00375 [Puniceicoccales bacterium]|jgi:hypothetical protein|nr:hypothetical protein [Puniceicoccales bacterium]
MKFLKIAFCAMVVLLLSQSQVSANTGLPMLFIFAPGAALLLVPVIFIETCVMCKMLKKINRLTVLKTATVSNVISTLIGVPLAWHIMLAVQLSLSSSSFLENWAHRIPDLLIMFVNSAWIGEKDSWAFALLSLQIPFCIISYWIEAGVSLRYLRKCDIPPKRIKLAVRNANIASYLFFAIVIVIVRLAHYVA